MSTRREFLSGIGAMAVLGYSTSARAWVPVGGATSHLKHVPPLDGELLMDPTSLAEAATDVGNIISETPRAVLRPGSVRDIQRMVRFCRRWRIAVAARGQGHTTFGQSQARNGLVVDMSTLNQIHAIGSDSVEIGAGLTWRALVESTLSSGLTAPVLTGYINLSIGGTLSVGGISSTNGAGAQVDRVRELEVVTGRGDVELCSAARRRDLFEAVLGGLGQCGIITRAVVDLVPAPELARIHLLQYTDNATFFSDMRSLLERGELDDVFTLWLPDGTGGLVYQLNAVKFYDSAQPPDTEHLLRGLSIAPSEAAASDSPYLEYILRVDAAIEFFKSIGLFDDVIHPWFDVFLPDSTVEQYIGELLPTLTPEDVGPTGFMLLFPQRRSEFSRPFLRLPKGDDEWVYLFDILTAAAAPGPDPEFTSRMLERNRAFFEKARDAGGTRYPIGALEFDRRDWIRHYGFTYPRFLHAKRRFDPAGILGRGFGIF